MRMPIKNEISSVTELEVLIPLDFKIIIKISGLAGTIKLDK